MPATLAFLLRDDEVVIVLDFTEDCCEVCDGLLLLLVELDQA